MSYTRDDVEVEVYEAKTAQLEDDAIQFIRMLARDLADLAGPVWRIGDGEGGFVLQILEDAFRDAGFLIGRLEHWLPGPPSRKATIPQSLRRAVYERDEYRCVDCGGWEKLSCDHVYPESKGGETTLENLATRCLPCNMKKGTKVL